MNENLTNIDLNNIKNRFKQRKIDDEQKRIIGNRFLNEFDAKKIETSHSENFVLNVDKNVGKIFSLLNKLRLSEDVKTNIYDLIVKDLKR